MRITKSSPNLPKVQRGKPIEVSINGKIVNSFEGELVSTVLQIEGISVFARKNKTGRPSGIYCGMGACYECLVKINGTANMRACQTFVANQMIIETV